MLTSDSHQRPHSFLDLPGELQNQIYHFALVVVPCVYIEPSNSTVDSSVFPGSTDISWHIRNQRSSLQDTSPNDQTFWIPESLPNTALLALNKQTREEAIGIFYGENTFEFSTSDLLAQFFAYWKTRPETRFEINKIGVHLHPKRDFGTAMQEWIGPSSLFEAIEHLDLKVLRIHTHMRSAVYPSIDCFTHELKFTPAAIFWHYSAWEEIHYACVELFRARLNLDRVDQGLQTETIAAPGDPVEELAEAVAHRLRFPPPDIIRCRNLYFETIVHEIRCYPKEWRSWYSGECIETLMGCIRNRMQIRVVDIVCDHAVEE